MTYSPTDLTSPLMRHLGEVVRIRHAGTDDGPPYTWTEGTLANVDEEGVATIVDDGDIVTELPAVVDVLLIDLNGYLYREDEHLGPWRMTPCCGASVKGLSSGLGCRACYGEVDELLDGPARIPSIPGQHLDLGPVQIRFRSQSDDGMFLSLDVLLRTRTVGSTATKIPVTAGVGERDRALHHAAGVLIAGFMREATPGKAFDKSLDTLSMLTINP